MNTTSISTTTNNACHIIGILDNGIASLCSDALDHIQQCDTIIGATRTLELVSTQLSKQCKVIDFGGKMSAVPQWIEDALAQQQHTVVLTTGDPLCHGIVQFLRKKLPVSQLRVWPTLSTLQLAFSRWVLPWQGFQIASIHSGKIDEWQRYADSRHGLYALLQRIRQQQSLAIFTSPINTPAMIARMMVMERLTEGWNFVVAENLQRDNETVQQYTVTAAAETNFSDTNVVLLWPQQPQQETVRFGLPDEFYFQRKPEKGLITKREVRAVSLARMQLTTNSIVWDIGAGSGSVGLEAAQIASHGHVYAIEKNLADNEIIEQNRQKMGLTNYTLQQGKAPEFLDSWLDPDAVFIGGSGGELAQIITTALQRLTAGGWLVINVVTFENLHTVQTTLQQLCANWDITQISLARSKPILDMYRLAAENSIFIISAQKEVENG